MLHKLLTVITVILLVLKFSSKMIDDSNDETNFSHKLLLTDR